MSRASLGPCLSRVQHRPKSWGFHERLVGIVVAAVDKNAESDGNQVIGLHEHSISPQLIRRAAFQAKHPLSRRDRMGGAKRRNLDGSRKLALSGNLFDDPRKRRSVRHARRRLRHRFGQGTPGLCHAHEHYRPTHRTHFKCKEFPRQSGTRRQFLDICNFHLIAQGRWFNATKPPLRLIARSAPTTSNDWFRE
jgi:hypothetical protein